MRQAHTLRAVPGIVLTIRPADQRLTTDRHGRTRKTLPEELTSRQQMNHLPQRRAHRPPPSAGETTRSRQDEPPGAAGGSSTADPPTDLRSRGGAPSGLSITANLRSLSPPELLCGSWKAATPPGGNRGFPGWSLSGAAAMSLTFPAQDTSGMHVIMGTSRVDWGGFRETFTGCRYVSEGCRSGGLDGPPRQCAGAWRRIGLIRADLQQYGESGQCQRRLKQYAP
jgi:hypothetical protein